MPPMANPVWSRTKRASGRIKAQPTISPTRSSSTALKTSDLTIWPAMQPQAAAASSAVLVLSAMVVIRMARPSTSAAVTFGWLLVLRRGGEVV
jgi:hypothetical protein